MSQLAEKGQPVPRQLQEPSPGRQNASLRAGLILVGLGIGLGLFFYEVKAPWSIGFVPGLMGVAMLIGWAIEKRSDKARSPPPRQRPRWPRRRRRAIPT